MKKFILLLVFSVSLLFAYDMKSESVVLTKSGIEGISDSTRFKKLTIKRIFPKLNVVDSSISSEGEKYPVILVKRSNKLLLTIKAKQRDRLRVGVVEISSKDINNQLDFNIGDKYQAIFVQKKVRCFRGAEENFEKVYCEDPDYDKFLFEFSGKLTNDDNKVPSKNTLRKWTLSKIIWDLEKK